MLDKLMRAMFGKPRQPVETFRVHESGQIAMLSTQEMARHQMYERMAQHQRLIEVEDDLRRR